VVERITSCDKAPRRSISSGYRQEFPMANQFIEEAVRSLGKIDILVNNAGWRNARIIWDVTEADFDAVLNVNLKGMFFCTQAVVRHLRQTNRLPGKSSHKLRLHEELPFPLLPPICASKGGIKMLTRNLAIELAPNKIPSTR